jgi:hypothetical protein
MRGFLTLTLLVAISAPLAHTQVPSATPSSPRIAREYAFVRN